MHYGGFVLAVVLALLVAYVAWGVLGFVYRHGRRMVREYLDIRRAEQRRLSGR